MLQAFDEADVSHLPSIHSLGDDLSCVLWILLVGSELGYAAMTPKQVSDVLRDAYAVALSRQKIQALLAAEKGSVARRKQTGVLAYQVMELGKSRIMQHEAAVLLIDPDTAFTGIRKIEEILGGLSGRLDVCDPYIDKRSLVFLAECTGATAIRLLTANIAKQAPFKTHLQAFNSEHGNILEVRVVSAKDIHDRYVVHADGLLLLGTSLNGLGKKQSLVVELGADFRAAMLTAFVDKWASASAL